MLNYLLLENWHWYDRLWRIASLKHISSITRRDTVEFLKILGGTRELYLIWNVNSTPENLILNGGIALTKGLQHAKKFSELTLSQRKHLKLLCETELGVVIEEDILEKVTEIIDSNSTIEVNKPKDSEQLNSSIKRLRDHYYDPKMFDPILVDETLDKFFTNKGGIMPATITMIVGDPGIGKTSVWMSVLAKVQTLYIDKKVLFVSAEMDEIDLKEYIDRMPEIGDIDTYFIGQYIENQPRERLENLFSDGYDLVLLDSFTEIIALIRDEYNMTSSGAESWLLNQMIKVKSGENLKNSFTSFLVIAQILKSGSFVGSNKLKHNTTAFLEMRWDEKERYIEFVKNRRGNVNQKLYFTLSEEGVKYDASRLNQALELSEMVSKNKIDFDKRATDFNKIFKIDEESIDDEE